MLNRPPFGAAWRTAPVHTVCLLAAVTACLPAHADDAALLRCRALTEPAARLACYDAVPLTAAARPGAPSAAAAATAAATAPAPSSSEKFGLEAKAAAETDRITSLLPGPFEGWGPRQIFKLANGQVWQATEGGSAYYQLRDPKVTVRRAAFGSFMMEIEGVAHILRVRRIQ